MNKVKLRELAEKFEEEAYIWERASLMSIQSQSRKKIVNGLVEFAESLTQWKYINGEDDLPKERGLYVVQIKEESPPFLAFFDDDEVTKASWLGALSGYIPFTLPEFKNQNEKTKPV